MFCQFNNKIVNVSYIKFIDCSEFLTSGEICVYCGDNVDQEYVKNAEALQLIMMLQPSVLEGKQGKYWKNQWAVHNLIGHPLMQVLSWLGLPMLAIWVHDMTIPCPKMPIKRQ